AHVEADDAGADDAELFRYVGNRQRAFVVEHTIVVHRDTGQRTRLRARGNDHVLGNHLRSSRTFDGDLPRVALLAGERSASMEKRDLVLLEQIQDAVVVLPDDLVLAREHLRNIDRKALNLDAVIAKRVMRVLEVLRRLEQRLRWNAADVR